MPSFPRLPSGGLHDVQPETIEATLQRAEAVICELRRLATTVRQARGDAHSEHKAIAAPPVLEVSGARTGRRTVVRVDDVEVALQDSVLLVLMRLVHAHLRAPGEWTHKDALGIARAAWMISRVRRDLRRALPVNFEIVQADRREHFRLNPRLMVLPVDLAALADHPDGGVRRVIAGWNGPSRSGRP